MGVGATTAQEYIVEAYCNISEVYLQEIKVVGVVLLLWAMWTGCSLLYEFFGGKARRLPIGRRLTGGAHMKVKRAFGGGDMIWTDYRAYFNRVADGNGWNSDERLLWLSVNLTGQAETFVNGLQDKKITLIGCWVS
jgi:hypothetical protein